MRKIAYFVFPLFLIAGNLASNELKYGFEELTNRGIEMYNYDFACTIATDTIRSSNPDTTKLGMYLAESTNSGWRVAFGKLDSTRMRFLVGYEVVFNTKMQVKWINEFTPPTADSAWYLRAALASTLAEENFQPMYSRYNAIVLPESSGSIAVYFVPAQTRLDSIPYCGDIKIVTSGDGTEIVDIVQPHASVLVTAPPTNDVKYIFHTHAVYDLPFETDVFYVLRRGFGIGEIIRSENWIYIIFPDGRVASMKPPSDN